MLYKSTCWAQNHIESLTQRPIHHNNQHFPTLFSFEAMEFHCDGAIFFKDSMSYLGIWLLSEKFVPFLKFFCSIQIYKKLTSRKRNIESLGRRVGGLDYANSTCFLLLYGPSLCIQVTGKSLVVSSLLFSFFDGSVIDRL